MRHILPTFSIILGNSEIAPGSEMRAPVPTDLILTNRNKERLARMMGNVRISDILQIGVQIIVQSPEVLL